MAEPTPEDLEDRENMLRLAEGHDSSMNALMHRWRNPLLGFLIRMVGDHSTASDLAQETFVRIYRHRHAYNPAQSFSTWMFTIAANLARNTHRWRRRHPEALTEPDILADQSPACPGPDPHQQSASREKLDAVQTAIAKLPRDQREVLILSVYQGQSHEEIAAITNSTVKAVELRLYRARKALKERLSDFL
jgi:RNA polymerase sigma-70 factor (ECF subfamily)